MRRSLCLKGLFLICFALSLGLVHAQDSDTISSIDQALIALDNLEQNQIALKALLNEKENTISKKELLLNQMTDQYQSSEVYCSLLKKENKLSKILNWVFIGAIVLETTYIVVKSKFD